MADKKPGKSVFNPLYPGDRATAPAALEEDSPSAWARFEEAQRAIDKPFAPTQPPGATVPGGPEWAATQPMLGAGLPPAPAKATRIASLDDVMALARRNNRSCPMPMPWAALCKVLAAQPAAAGQPPLPGPIGGAAWAATSSMHKRLRLRDQVEWAQRAGLLQLAYEALAALDEAQWHHFDD